MVLHGNGFDCRNPADHLLCSGLIDDGHAAAIAAFADLRIGFILERDFYFIAAAAFCAGGVFNILSC